MNEPFFFLEKRKSASALNPFFFKKEKGLAPSPFSLGKKRCFTPKRKGLAFIMSSVCTDFATLGAKDVPQKEKRERICLMLW